MQPEYIMVCEIAQHPVLLSGLTVLVVLILLLPNTILPIIGLWMASIATGKHCYGVGSVHLSVLGSG